MCMKVTTGSPTSRRRRLFGRTATQQLFSTTPSPWWQDQTADRIYPSSFADSNGDGIGGYRNIPPSPPPAEGGSPTNREAAFTSISDCCGLQSINHFHIAVR